LADAAKFLADCDDDGEIPYPTLAALVPYCFMNLAGAVLAG
jgi:hypothetical protein